LYNVLEKVRRPVAGVADPGRPGSTSPATILTAKEKLLHDQALVATLRQLHDELDAAVADAYGWPWPLRDEEILARVVALNAARAAEEAKGQIRWLRPDFQKPLFAGEKQSSLGLDDSAPTAGKTKNPTAAGQSKIKNRKSKIPWPKTLAERVRAIETALAAEEKPATAADLATRFARADPAVIAEILQTLVTLGRARPGDDAGTFVR
ncbi:MAG: class I SAM-dependent DNA methyltransferase, partial [Opitutaceae bacterium]